MLSSRKGRNLYDLVSTPHPTVIKVREGLRAGEVVGEGRVEEGGGVRGSEASRRSTRGDQAAVCVHIDTQSSGFGSDEAHFILYGKSKYKVPAGKLGKTPKASYPIRKIGKASYNSENQKFKT